MNLKSDFKIQVDGCREELGLSNPSLSPKINLYSLSRIVELMLEHLMINNLYFRNSGNDSVQ